MIINKTKNAARNALFGILLKIYQIVVPFIFRTVMVYTLGVEYLGLNSLFVSILQVLNLMELGVGSAMVFAMYKPIAEDDTTTICALMKLYKIYYRIIGAVILCIGVAIIPILPKLINGSIPQNINIYILYLLNLSATVLTYWLFAYKNSVLQAHQRQDVISIITIITDTLKYIMQFVALVIFRDYYYYVICVVISQILTNIFTAISAQRIFPKYKEKGKLQKNEIIKINKKIRDLFTAKFGGTVVSSADTIVISAFLGLSTLAVYQNYYYIVGSILGFIMILNNSVLAGIGNSMQVKSREENYSEFKTFTFLQFWIMGFCISCFSVLLQPFMTIWMGEELLFDNSMVVLFCVYFMGFQLEKLLSVYKDAGGIWHQDRFRPLAYGLANLIINIFLVRYIGIYGIILSTILSVFAISIPWILHNIFNEIFKGKLYEYLKCLLRYSTVCILTAVVTTALSSFIPNGKIFSFLLKCLLCIFSPNLFMIFIYRNDLDFRKCLRLVKKFRERSL